MLIQCGRHTAEDLRLWAGLEKADRFYARRKDLTRKEEKAKRDIGEFLECGPAYLGVSWGKDSMVVAHLAKDFDLPYMWVRVEPIFNPYCLQVRDVFLACHEINYSEVEVWCEKGGKGWLAGGTLEKGIAQFVAESNIPRYISGIRANESIARTRRYHAYGVSSRNTCAPLSRWSAQDIFAYLAKYDLPVHPNYAMLGGGRYPREHLRVASLGGIRGREMGRYEWEWEYYGDILRQTGRLK